MRMMLLSVFSLLIIACTPVAAVHDAGVHDVIDAGQADAGTLDAGVVDAGPGAPCAFNSDCPDVTRCSCSEADGCACVVGARGTGVACVDACARGDDCASSVCLEGPGGALVCSGPCNDNSDCHDKLPQCADVALVGRICVRASP